MTKNKELTFWKLLAFGSVALYIYKMTKANGGTLAGTPLANVNPDKVSNIAATLVSEQYRPYVRSAGKKVMNHLLKRVIQ